MSSVTGVELAADDHGSGAPLVPGVSAADLREEGSSTWRLFASEFIRNKLALGGLALIVIIVLFCFIGPLIYHTDQVHTQVLDANLSPSAKHPLGTDGVGYDVLGRLMVGGQSSIEVGLGAALLSSIFGAVWGAVSGYAGRWVDSVMMRVVDSIYAIPPLLLMLLLASMFAPTTLTFVIVVAIVSWLPTARLVRGETLSIRVREYVEAAQSMGVRRHRIILRHVMPNVAGTVIVQTTLQIANAITLLAALSYLGLGPLPPHTNWGEMLNSGLDYIYDGYWWLIYPAGLAIVLSVLAFSLVGEALRDALDVRLQRR